MTFFCVKCKLEYPQHRQKCKCGAVFSIIKSPCPQTAPKKIASVVELLENKALYEEIPGFEFMQALPKKWTAMVYGLPGAGKSFFCLKLLSEIAKRYPERLVLYWSFEEGFDETLKNKFRDFDLSKDIYFSIADSFSEFTDQVKIFNPAGIVIDSLSNAGLGENEVYYFKRNVNCPALFICHATKDEKYRGESDVGHATDINIEVKEVKENKENIHKAIIKKSRFGPSGEEMVLEWK